MTTPDENKLRGREIVLLERAEAAERRVSDLEARIDERREFLRRRLGKGHNIIDDRETMARLDELDHLVANAGEALSGGRDNDS